MISYMFTEHTKSFRAELPHLPVLQEVDKALKAVGAAGRYGALRALAQQNAPAAVAHVRKPDVAPILRRRTRGRRALRAQRSGSKALLRAYGIATPREVVAGSVEDAVRAANDIGYPVVLKILAAEVTHKSDIGGVILGIKSDDELRGAYSRLARNLANARPGARLDQVLVAEQVSGGVELVLGVQRDPEVGPVLMFGTGGVLLELHKDVSFGAVPLRLAGQGDARAHQRRPPAGGLSRRAALRRGQRARRADRARAPRARSRRRRSRASTSIRWSRCPPARAPSRSMRWWCCGTRGKHDHDHDMERTQDRHCRLHAAR